MVKVVNEVVVSEEHELDLETRGKIVEGTDEIVVDDEILAYAYSQDYDN